MSEQQLKDFGARAETLVDVPDFAELDSKGAHLQTRRRLGVAAGLALVLAVAGAGVTQNHRSSADHDPVNLPPPTTTAVPYPGNTMTTLDEGSYALQSCCVPGHSTSDFASNPVAELAVPRGWNAWVGPNRFDGHAPGLSNEEALGHRTWYVGVLVLEVDAVNTRGCGWPRDARTQDGGRPRRGAEADLRLPGDPRPGAGPAVRLPGDADPRAGHEGGGALRARHRGLPHLEPWGHRLPGCGEPRGHLGGRRRRVPDLRPASLVAERTGCRTPRAGLRDRLDPLLVQLVMGHCLGGTVAARPGRAVQAAGSTRAARAWR